MTMPTGWLRPGSRTLTEYFFRHPHGRHEDVGRVGEKCRLVAFDEMSEPCQCESGGDQKESDDPVKPDNNKGRESDGDCDQVQRAVHRVVMRAIVVRVEAHRCPRFRAGLYREIDRNEAFKYFVGKHSTLGGEANCRSVSFE